MTRNANHAATVLKKGNPMKRLVTTLLSASCMLAPLALVSAPAAHAQSMTRPANDFVLSIGRGQLVTIGGAMADVFVANDSVADVQVKSQRQLYVFGKAGGETTVYASNAAGDIIWSANIRVGSNIDSVDQMLRMAMPDAKVAVSTMGTNTFLLTGTVSSPEDASEAARLVNAFVGKDANVITRLKTATPLQVNLRVKFAEVSRSLVKQIGASLTSVDDSGGFKFGIGQGQAFKQVAPSFVDPVTGLRQPMGPMAVGPNYKGEGYNIINQIATGTTIAGAGRLFGMDVLGALDMGETLG
ncbi:MAG: hypothetical protein RL299_2153, partial [Pseudomonadota bacterium]